MVIQRMFRPDGHIAEQAKAHGRLLFGMMARWADGGKGIGRLAAQDHIHGANHRTDGAIGSGKTARRHMRIGIKRHPATVRRGLADRGDIAGWMDAQQVIFGGKGRFDLQKVHPRQCPNYRIQSRHLFRVAGWGDVVQTFGMCDQRSCHVSKEQKYCAQHK